MIDLSCDDDDAPSGMSSDPRSQKIYRIVV